MRRCNSNNYTSNPMPHYYCKRRQLNGSKAIVLRTLDRLFFDRGNIFFIICQATGCVVCIITYWVSSGGIFQFLIALPLRVLLPRFVFPSPTK